MTFRGGIILGLFLLAVGFPLYASFVHNQCFSDAAGLARTIHKGDSCEVAERLIREYIGSNKSSVSHSVSSIADHPGWQHKEGVTSVIRLDDDSSPFEHITYYAFCSQQEIVVDTLLVGDREMPYQGR